MLIPIEIKQSINPYSHYPEPSSKFHNKSLKYLFYCQENLNYLAIELYKNLSSVKNMNAIYKTNRNEIIAKHFTGKQLMFKNNIEFMVKCWDIPFKEELGTKNNISNLSNLNLEFLTITIKNLIQDPNNMIPDLKYYNWETNKIEKTNWDYDSSSYSDGTWHPEDLFINSENNRNNPYWKPIEINFDSDPQAKGLGHKYNDKIYGEKNQFPIWQTSVDNRAYETDTIDTLSLDDRRVQRPHGYNMFGLTRTSNLFKK